jgi:phage terminase small subunit
VGAVARPGPKGTSNLIKITKGTFQPCRSKDEVRSPSCSNDDLVCPDWLSKEAQKIWDDKVSIYNRAGLNMGDHGHALAQYCALEDALIKIYKEGKVPPMAMVSAHRIWAAEFYDTPAATGVKSEKKSRAGEWDDI